MVIPGGRFITPGVGLAAAAMFTLACSDKAPAQSFPTSSSDSVSATEEREETHPVSGLTIIPVQVISASGTHSFRTELANTPEAQARGMMFRTEVGPDEAMLFPSREPGLRSFWMKNVPIPLDIIFIGVDGRISNIAADTPPYTTDSVHSTGAATAVLELAGGRAAELGIAPGDRVQYSLP